MHKTFPFYFFLYPIINITKLQCTNIIILYFLCAAYDPKKPVQVAYVPGHLYHMLFELLKVCDCLLNLWTALFLTRVDHTYVLTGVATSF